MKNIFTSHPHSIGESYFQHLKFASCFGFTMLSGGVACLVHAVLPCFFEKTGSNILLKMTYDFIDRMPRAEEREIRLSQLIEKKREK